MDLGLDATPMLNLIIFSELLAHSIGSESVFEEVVEVLRPTKIPTSRKGGEKWGTRPIALRIPCWGEQTAPNLC